MEIPRGNLQNYLGGMFAPEHFDQIIKLGLDRPFGELLLEYIRMTADVEKGKTEACHTPRTGTMEDIQVVTKYNKVQTIIIETADQKTKS